MIKSITFDWHNWGLRCIDDIDHERTIVCFGKQNKIIVRRFNGYNQKLQEHIYYIPEPTASSSKFKIEKLLKDQKWEPDYFIQVCDGSHWELTVQYEDGAKQKMEGTAKKPPFGKKLKNIIYKMLKETFCEDMPILF